MQDFARETPREASVIVITEAASLSRLAKESRITALCGLAMAPDARVSGFPYAGRVWSDFDRPTGDLAEDERTKIEQKLDAAVAAVTDARSSTVVIFEHRKSGDIESLLARVERLLETVRARGGFKALDRVAWTLVLVAHDALNEADREQLQRLQSLKFILERETHVFSVCYTMSSKLEDAAGVPPLPSRDVWPIAVGRLLVSKALEPHTERDTDHWYRAWVSAIVPLTPEHDHFEQFMLGRANLIVEPTRFGESVLLPQARRTTPHGAKTQAESMGFQRLDSDGVPRSVADRETADDRGKFEGLKGPSLPEFVATEPGGVTSQFEQRCDGSSDTWRTRILSRSVRFRVDRDRRQTAPFRSLGHDAANPNSPTGVVRRSWEAIHKFRWNLLWFSQAQACEAFEVKPLVERQEEGWSELLEFHAHLQQAVARTRRIAGQQDEARAGFVALWARLVIAVATCLFVGFALTSVIAVATGGMVQAIVWGGVAAAAGSLLVTLAFAFLEWRAGQRGAAYADRALDAMEQGISDSLRLRLDLLRDADELRRKTIWMGTAARIRMLALRAKRIYDRATSEALASRRSMLEALEDNRRESVERYVKQTTASVLRDDSDAAVLTTIESLEQRQHDESSEFHKELRVLIQEMEQKWSAVADLADVELQGNLPTGPLFRSMFAAAAEVRIRLELGISRELLSDSLRVGDLHARVKTIVDRFSTGLLLSVATPGYTTGPGTEREPKVWHSFRDPPQGFDGYEFNDRLPRLGSACVFIHREQDLQVEQQGSAVVFKVVRPAAGGAP